VRPLKALSLLHSCGISGHHNNGAGSQRQAMPIVYQTRSRISNGLGVLIRPQHHIRHLHDNNLYARRRFATRFGTERTKNSRVTFTAFVVITSKAIDPRGGGFGILARTQLHRVQRLAVAYNAAPACTTARPSCVIKLKPRYQHCIIGYMPFHMPSTILVSLLSHAAMDTAVLHMV
jgi:hypothetical protein